MAFAGSAGHRRLSMFLRNIWCATIVAEDRQTGSLWLCNEGAAVAGPLSGTLLERVPAFQAGWREWHALHPETRVLVPPHEPRNRDERHGHASEETLARPGVSGYFVTQTVTPPIDTRLPENELVLAVTTGRESRVFPLREVRRAGSVVNTSLGGSPVVVWASPRRESFLMAAYLRSGPGGRPLTFRVEEDRLSDAETGSTWSPTGRSIGGKLAGAELTPVDFTLSRWHAWGWSHRATELYQAESSDRAPYEPPPFDRIIAALRRGGFEPANLEPVIDLQLPNEAILGVTAEVRDDRLGFFLFPNQVALGDYVRPQPHAVQCGSVVVQSLPRDRLCFRDSLHTQRIADDQMRWSPLVNPEDPTGRDFLEIVRRAAPALRASAKKGLGAVLDRLRADGLDIATGKELMIDGYRIGAVMLEIPRRQLPARCRSGCFLTLGGEDFHLYKFVAPAAAARYAAEDGHSLVGGDFVLRATPADMYAFPILGFGRKPDEEISWPARLTDPGFVAAFMRAASS